MIWVKERGRDDMAAKSANLYARIEPDVKEQAEGILATLGIPASNAINMFYKSTWVICKLICRFYKPNIIPVSNKVRNVNF